MPRLKDQDAQQMEKAKDLFGEDGGELGFVRSMFFGRLRLEQVMPYPRQDPDESARTDELLERVDAFLREHVDADRIDAEAEIPREVIDGLGELGVLGLTVPAEFGGGGFSHTAYCRVLKRVAEHCASTAVLVGAHQSIGLKALLLNGTDEQKRRWLPDLAAGRKLAAFCLSEPETGSDAANVQTAARLDDAGENWIINGQKKYSTNGAIAGVMTVMARTQVEIDGETKDRVTAFIVTPEDPGFAVVRHDRPKCGIRGSWQAELKFTDMTIPHGRVLGEVGGGLKVALTVLNYGRCTLSAGCLAGAEVALRRSVEHARTRVQFGRAIGRFGLVRKKIARMAELTFAMDALTWLAAGLVDRGAEDIMLETAISKLFCSEAGWLIVDDAVQIHGGEGYMRDQGLERMLRDARINRIVEGASEVMYSFVALMGMKGVGEQFEEVLRASRHPIANASTLWGFARQGMRNVVVGHVVDSTLDDIRPELYPHAATMARLVRRLARAVTRLLATHREAILDMQMVQERIALAAIELYATAAVISRLDALLDAADQDNDGQDLERQLAVGGAYCRHAASRIKRRLRGCFANLDEDRESVAAAVLDLSDDEPG